MAKIKRSLLKDIKKAAREFKKKEAQENKVENKPQYHLQCILRLALKLLLF